MDPDITLETANVPQATETEIAPHPEGDRQDAEAALQLLAILKGIGSSALAVSTGGASTVIPQLLNNVGGGGGSGLALGTGDDLGGLRRENEDFIRLQLAVQREMQVFTARSNVSKTLHESAMAAVRNIKA